MRYADELRKQMGDMTAAELSRRSGVSQASISGYLTGEREPNDTTKEKLAKALGGNREKTTLTVRECAGLMGKSTRFVEKGLQEGIFPFGYAVKLEEWSYFISAKRFTDMTGIEVGK